MKARATAKVVPAPPLEAPDPLVAEMALLRESVRRCSAVLAFIVRNGPFPDALAERLLAELGTSLAEIPELLILVAESDDRRARKH